MPIFGPDNGSAYVFLPNGRPAIGTLAIIFEDEALTVPATILAFQPSLPSVPGAVVPQSTVVVNAYGRLNFWFPDDKPVLYATVNGGPSVRITADLQSQLEAVQDALADVIEAADPTEAIEAYNLLTTDVHGIPDTSLLETLPGSTQKAAAAQTAATVAAAADATNKAAAAASAAISAAAGDATTKANAAIAVAATDATTKANAAQSAATSAAAADATTKSNSAQSAAIAAAATDATGKANAAQAAAIAASDPVGAATAAQAAAIAAAATDATTKAGNAQTAAAADASAKVAAHTGAADPHGDRSYADSAVSTLSGAVSASLAGKQPVDADLTALAALDSAQSGVVASDGSGWFRKTYAALKTAIGLNNVDNTSDAGKPVSTAQQTALNLKVDKRPTRRSVADYGAVADGLVDGTGTDDRAAIQAALNAGPGIVELSGFHKVTTPGLSIPADVWLRGHGESTGIIPTANYNYNVVRIDNTNGRVSDLIVKRVTGSTSLGVGVAVLGGSADALVERVVVLNANSGFRSAGELGAVSATALRPIFRNCIAKNSEAYGFEVDNTDSAEIDNCQSIVHYQDGVKLRRMAKNTRVTGGYYTGGIIGDGMDCFAGGDQFLVSGVVFAGNLINGLTIKNDDLNRTDPATYGYVRNFSVVGCIATGNNGNGFTCHRSSGTPDDPTEPLVTRGIFSACGAYGNGAQGYYLQSRQVTLTGCTASRNGQWGFYLEPVCRDMALMGCHASGNSVTSAGARDGFLIDGSRIQVVACSSVGSDPDGAIDDAALLAGTKTQRYGFLIQAAATEVDFYANNALANATADIQDNSAKVRWVVPPGGARASAGLYFTQAGGRSATAQTISIEYAVAQWIEAPCTINKLGCEITTAAAAGGIIRLGVRAVNAANQPGAILGQTSVVSTAIATVENAGNLGIVIPKPGWYYFTSKAEVAAGTVRMCSGPTGGPSSGASLTQALGATANAGYITAALADGVLADPYTISNRAGLMPIVAWRQ